MSEAGPNLSQLLTIPMPDFVSMERAAAQRHADAKKAVTVPGRFIGVSLDAWLPRVADAGVPFVPATAVITVPRPTFMCFDRPLPEHGSFWKAFASACAAVPQGHMLRWDACSSLDLKFAMSETGSASNEDRRELTFADPRAIDILVCFPADEFKVLARPWADPLVVEGYPVEFRVFIRNNVVEGVASYYPQRPLPESSEMQALAAACRAAAEQIVSSLNTTGEYPWMPGFEAAGFEPGKVSATIDFLVTPQNDILFLEAGPPFGAGAHPCAFLDREAIEGVALSLAPGAILR